jgi:hypothetical protein
MENAYSIAKHTISIASMIFVLQGSFDFLIHHYFESEIGKL